MPDERQVWPIKMAVLLSLERPKSRSYRSKLKQIFLMLKAESDYGRVVRHMVMVSWPLSCEYSKLHSHLCTRSRGSLFHFVSLKSRPISICQLSEKLKTKHVTPDLRSVCNTHTPKTKNKKWSGWTPTRGINKVDNTILIHLN